MNRPGRWPANVILDDEAAALLDAQSGERKAGVAVRRNGNAGRGTFPVRIAEGSPDVGYGDTGGASRFFARANTRDEVIEWLVRLITPPGGVVLLIGVNRNDSGNGAKGAVAK